MNEEVTVVGIGSGTGDLGGLFGWLTICGGGGGDTPPDGVELPFNLVRN